MATQVSSTQITSPVKAESCSFCKKPGHKVDTCFARIRSESRNKNNVNFCHEMKDSRQSVDIVVAVIQGIPVDILIDSGSTISLISSSLIKHFTCSCKPAFRILKGIGSQEVESTSYVTLPVEFDDVTLEVDLFVIAAEYMNTPVIIGTDVLNRDDVTYVRTRERQRITRNIKKHDNVLKIDYDLRTRPNTNLVGDDFNKLFAIINEFSNFFITGTASSTVKTGSM